MQALRCAIIISLSVIYLLTVKISILQSAEMKGSRQNNLETLLFVPMRGLLVGDSVSGLNGSIRLWSVKDGNQIDAIALGNREWVKSMTVSHDGKLIAVALFRSDEIGCYSIEEKRWLWKVKWHGKNSSRYSMAFTADDHSVAVVGFDRIVFYNSGNGHILQEMSDTSGFSNGYSRNNTRLSALSPDARYVVMWQGNIEHDEALSWNPDVWSLVWDLEKKEIIWKQHRMQKKYKNCSAVFAMDEKRVLLGSMDGYIRGWSISEKKLVREWKANAVGIIPPNDTRYTSPFPIHMLVLSGDGRYLATMGDDTATFDVNIFDYKTNKLIYKFADVTTKQAMCSSYPMAFSHDSKYFALEKNGKLCLYATATWKEKWCVPSIPN